MKKNPLIAICTPILLLIANACTKSSWTKDELQIISSPDQVLRVLTIDNAEDSLFLKRKCAGIPEDALSGEMYNTLASKMIATVTSPQQDGVGIAGPQVGISRRIVAVQRFDREGEPFEVYPNISIIACRGDMVPGMEGCLSVPGRSGEVLRYQDIDIKYTLPARNGMPARDTAETVTGFTAVIFQHECDHLDGILYIEKLSDCDSK
ncbi:MAG: peptide deformylase [Candidatus Cryptobacteroides sp.]